MKAIQIHTDAAQVTILSPQLAISMQRYKTSKRMVFDLLQETLQWIKQGLHKKVLQKDLFSLMKAFFEHFGNEGVKGSAMTSQKNLSGNFT